jgi:hypothetical protein
MYTAYAEIGVHQKLDPMTFLIYHMAFSKNKEIRYIKEQK